MSSFEILTMGMKSAVFWDITPTGLIRFQRNVGCDHLKIRRGSRKTKGPNIKQHCCSVYSSVLKMEAVRSSEALNFYQTTRRHIPESCNHYFLFCFQISVRLLRRKSCDKNPMLRTLEDVWKKTRPIS
jgi:hypothetical protein